MRLTRARREYLIRMVEGELLREAALELNLWRPGLGAQATAKLARIADPDGPWMRAFFRHMRVTREAPPVYLRDGV